MRSWMNHSLKLTAISLGLLATAAAMAAPTYRIELVGKSNGLAPKWASSISDNGSIAGVANDSQTGKSVTFRSRRGKKVEALSDTKGMPYPGEPQLNNSGVVVGRYSTVGGDRGGVWASDGTLTDLAPVVGCDDSREVYPYAIGDNGAMLIYADCKSNGVPLQGGFLVRDGVAAMVPPLNGSPTYPSAMNKRGQVTGTTDYLTGDQHAFIWQEGKPIRQLSPAGQDAYPYSINDLGHVVGMKVINLTWTSFLHDGTAMRELPKCGTHDVWPLAINNDGWIAGNFHDSFFDREAALIRNGECAELRSLLDDSGASWTELSVDDMNNNGVIVGHGRFEGYRRVFVATPLSR